VKLPFTIKVPDVGALFARLNPAKLLSKLKKGDADDDDTGEDDGDLFDGLGNLDQLDAEALEDAVADDGHEQDDDEPDVLDEVDGSHEPDFADLDAEDDVGEAADQAGSAGEDGGLVAEIMGDLEDFNLSDDFDGDDEDEDDEAAQKAKVKKLALFAGGGVVVAVVLGGVAWWLLGDGATTEMADQSASDAADKSGTVISLDSLPPLPSDLQPEPARTAQKPMPSGDRQPTDGGLAPPAGASTAMPPPADGGEEDTRTELQKLGLDVQMEPGVGVVIPASTPTSYTRLGSWPKAAGLVEAPLETLVQKSDEGLLPRIGEDGTTPFDAYRRPASQTAKDASQVAIIVTDLGLSRAATEAAIDTLPSEVTLSLDVYARGLDFWIKRAREAGHEVLLNLPSESADFPFSDPGPDALQSLAAPEENLAKLHAILGRTSGYFGVFSVYGSKFLTVEEQLSVVLEELKNRGLMYVDGGLQDSQGSRVAYKLGAKWASVDLNIDAVPGRSSVERQLVELEALAKKRVQAVARISSNPGSLEALAVWLRNLKGKGLQLVPVSALANKQLIR